MRQKIILMILAILFVGCNKVTISNFDECARAGYAVMESYPRQCRTKDGQLFVEKISDEIVACTMDAKVCPDGTSVGRMPPNCEFEPCPGEEDIGSLPYTARFEVFTNGLKRDFGAEMYLNQSKEVYLDKSDPTTIHVNSGGVTWNDFFMTLPFSVTSECLTTGTGQKFCSNSQQKLRFELNGRVVLSVLNNQIGRNEYLKIVYE